MVDRELLELLAPGSCLGCGRSPATSRRRLGLCAACFGRLSRLPAGCSRCGRPLRIEPLPAGYCCGRCRLSPPAVDQLWALYQYASPLAEVIRAVKFHRRVDLVEPLGRLVAEPLRSELAGYDALVPVPLHWLRRLRRGYDQADGLARAMSAPLGLPVVKALVRRRATRAQSSLARDERLRNLEGSFRARPAGFSTGAALLLVDDVVTSGATLEAAARTLLGAGAGKVAAVVVARTPEPEEVGEGLQASWAVPPMGGESVSRGGHSLEIRP